MSKARDLGNLGSDIPNQVLTALNTVDGAGSGLDADLLGGQSSAAFLPVAPTADDTYPLVTYPYVALMSAEPPAAFSGPLSDTNFCIRLPTAGSVRLRFRLYGASTITNSHAKIYHNGSLVRTMQTNSTSPISYVQDFTCNKGDFVSVVFWRSGSNYAYHDQCVWSSGTNCTLPIPV